MTEAQIQGSISKEFEITWFKLVGPNCTYFEFITYIYSK